MSAYADGRATIYLSARSADVILSEVRPTKLKPEALRCINTLLDELLWQVLSAAGSLATDRLKTGTARALPTSLGKEALLEAEVELRAYWERTNPGGVGPASIEQPTQFSQELAFELLRLKCEGYSTLNDSDEDGEAESRLVARFSSGQIFKPTAIAPAALYMTAILEFLCEHILSNVGRVASRDSSTTFATVQDLFVALSEDDSIFPVFKGMKVYEQIQAQAKPRPKSRRSQSISRSDFDPSSPMSSTREFGLSSPAVRPSTDTAGTHAGAPPSSYARPSMDKSRAVKIFKSVGSKTSMDRDGEADRNGISLVASGTENSRNQTPTNEVDATDLEDDGMDFDDLMRSGTTMKVSLTPDRLRTFEGYAKNRDARGMRNQGVSQKADFPVTATPEGLKGVNMNGSPGTTRNDGARARSTASRNMSVDRPSVPALPPVPGRSRAISTSGTSAPPSAFPNMDRRVPPTKGMMPDMPQKTRRIARRTDSIDFDDMLDGSDDEDDGTSKDQAPSQQEGFIRRQRVSNQTRELMDFLSEGPPEDPHRPPMSPGGNMDGRKQGRLTRMVSRLTRLQSMERINGRESPDRLGISSAPTTPTPTLSSKKSYTGLQLANKPVPPRPPPLPTAVHESLSSPLSDDVNEKRTASSDQNRTEPPQSPSIPNHEIPARVSSRNAVTNGSLNSVQLEPASTARTHGSDASIRPPSLPSKQTPAFSNSPPDQPPHSNGSDAIVPHAIIFQKLLGQATTVDECRVLASMFLARCGVSEKDLAADQTVSATREGAEKPVLDLLLGEGVDSRLCRYESVNVQTDDTHAVDDGVRAD